MQQVQQDTISVSYNDGTASFTLPEGADKKNIAVTVAGENSGEIVTITGNKASFPAIKGKKYVVCVAMNKGPAQYGSLSVPK